MHGGYVFCMCVCVCNVFTDRQKQAGVKRAKVVVQRVARWKRTSNQASERDRKNRLIEWGPRSSTWGSFDVDEAS